VDCVNAIAGHGVVGCWVQLLHDDRTDVRSRVVVLGILLYRGRSRHGHALDPSLIHSGLDEFRPPPDADDVANSIRHRLLDDDAGAIGDQRLQAITLQTKAVNIRERVYVD
jgi:hypothetical protein